jgi:hypothetical protein
MNKTIINIRATSTIVLANLMNLDDYMATCNSNIDVFNHYATVHYKVLKAKGVDDPSFIIYILKGYKAAADEQFVSASKTNEMQMTRERTLITFCGWVVHSTNTRPLWMKTNGGQ